MLKTIVKLALAALVVNAAWRVGTEFLAHARFREAVRAETLAAGTNLQDDLLKQRILAHADGMGIDLFTDSLTIRRDQRRVVVRGAYEKVIEVAPGFPYTRLFDWEVDVFVAPSLR